MIQNMRKNPSELSGDNISVSNRPVYTRNYRYAVFSFSTITATFPVVSNRWQHLAHMSIVLLNRQISCKSSGLFSHVWNKINNNLTVENTKHRLKAIMPRAVLFSESIFNWISIIIFCLTRLLGVAKGPGIVSFNPYV